MQQNEIAQMAHLLRRAGFGATRGELEGYVARGYEVVVEDLLHLTSGSLGLEDEDLIRRYHVDANNLMLLETCQAYWLYRMINTDQPLVEKIALFWHNIFATGYGKLNQPKAILRQIDMFRRCGLESFHTLLSELSKDPAMIFWLDNKDNHKEAVNENYGRELLELFSMGQGNYTEYDVKQASQAFTGWTIRNASLHTARVARDSVWPYGRLDWQFEYRSDDHDGGEKLFLGHTGRFNGNEIIDIICQQRPTAEFIARHLYSFFVADEVQVPSWKDVPPRDPVAVAILADAFINHNYVIRDVLRVLFNSDFFKNACFERVKSPVEFVVGTARMAGGYKFPSTEDSTLAAETNAMGQRLLDPPSVEGWHTGTEWINTSSLMSRINFASDQFADVDKPGVRSIIDRIKAQGSSVSPQEMVDYCLDLMGPITTSVDTRAEIIAHVDVRGELTFHSIEDSDSSAERIREVLDLIVGTREYQLC